MPKFVYAAKTYSNKNTNCLLMEEKRVEIEILENQKPFIEYWETTDDVCECLENYNPIK